MKMIPSRQLFRNKLFVLTFGFILTANVILSQDSELTRINTRVSPEASSGGFSGAGSSVDMFRGTLNTSIPIHNYSGREMNLPINLSYSATGIKVDQVANSAGLGWNLNVGGRITKVVSVASDNSYTNNNAFPNMDSPQQLCDSENIDLNFQNPDYYQVSAMGFEDVLQCAEIWPYIRSLVNPYNVVSLSAEGIRTPRENAIFKIVNEREEEYYFGGGNSEVTIINSSAPGCTNINEKSTTSWLLTKVISSNKLDVYEFEYQNFIWLNDIENNGEGITSGNSVLTYLSKYRMNQQMIKRILHNGKKIVEFNYDQRADLAFLNAEGNRLSSIDFFNFNDTSIFKKVTFSHSYFGNADSNSFVDKRLKLEKISFTGFTPEYATMSGDEFSFTYIEDTISIMPSITSYARDYLGLYNGKDTNIELVTNGLGACSSSTVCDCNPSGSNRSYNHEKAIIGTLESITNPTKGKTVFEYEQNALNGGYGTVSVQGPPHEVETQLALHRHDIINCEDLPLYYTGINSTMQPDGGLLTNNFPEGPNTHYPEQVVQVRTSVMNLTSDSLCQFLVTGNGVFMIQKINDNGLPPVTVDACALTIGEAPVFDGSLLPTSDLFYDGNSNSHPSDFVTGGLMNSGNEIQAENLTAGKYQITTWAFAAGNSDDLYVTIYRFDQIYDPPHDVNQDVTTDVFDGFRIKSITNLDADSNFVSKKAYKYKTGYWLDLVANRRVTNFTPSFSTIQRLSRGYSNPSEIVHYKDVFEVDLDSEGHDNGYVEYKFDYDGAGKIVPFKYSTDVRDPTSISNYDYDKVDMVSEKKIFNKAGDIVFKEIYDWTDDRYLNDGYLPDIIYYKLSKIESTSYINASPSITKIQNFLEYSEKRLTYKTIGNDEFSYLYDEENPSGFTFRMAQIDSNIKGVTRFIYSSRPGLLFDQTSAVTRRLLTEIQHANHGDTPLLITKFDYDSDGNKVQNTQYTPENPNPAGIESYIYGYDNRFIVAKLTGVKYSEISSGRIAAIKSDSNKSVSDLNDGNLRTSLNLLRSDFPDALITTYTYNPVYGITSVTDPKEYTIFSEYDTLGRLLYTKERMTRNDNTVQINILSKNEYHTVPN